jgi:hypothetical protein
VADAVNPIDFLESLPESSRVREVRPQLKLLFTSFDQLLFLDNNAELSVDRETLIRIVSDDDLTPTILRDVMLVETSKYLGRRVKSAGEGQRISWTDGERFGLPIHPPSMDDLRAMDLDPSMGDPSEDAVRAQFPDIPEFWVEPDSSVLYDRVVERVLANQTVWDCLVRNLGFWAALTVIGSIIIVLIVLPAAGWWVTLWILAAFHSFATAYFILQCVVNPSYVA